MRTPPPPKEHLQPTLQGAEGGGGVLQQPRPTRGPGPTAPALSLPAPQLLPRLSAHPGALTLISSAFGLFLTAGPPPVRLRAHFPPHTPPLFFPPPISPLSRFISLTLLTPFPPPGALWVFFPPFIIPIKGDLHNLRPSLPSPSRSAFAHGCAWGGVPTRKINSNHN